MTILTESREYAQLLSNTQFSLICLVEYPPEVDTHVTINIEWTATSPFIGNSRVTFAEGQERLHTYNSTATFNPILLSDSGLYTCLATVTPNDDPAAGSTVYKSLVTREEINIHVCKYKS